MYYLLKFGYYGRNFTGYQRGNGNKSVEDSILRVMRDYGISEKISSAARTDRGVSAGGNIIFFGSEMEIGKIIGILNSQLKGIIIHSYAEVSKDFRVRFSRMKHYRYILFGKDVNTNKFDAIMKNFVGTHDFSLFSRSDSRSPVRTVEEISCIQRSGYVEVNIYGPNFVWNQIRSMVGFASYYATSSVDAPDPFKVEKKRWTMAHPEPLILMDIQYKDVEFIRYISRKKINIWMRGIRDVMLQSSILYNILDSAVE